MQPSDEKALLRVEALTKRFGGLVAVSEVTFSVRKGVIVSVVGPNGAGKTTLFNLITGVIAPDAGSIFFNANDVTGLQPHRLAKAGIGRTFQNVRLFRNLNALENVMVGATCRGEANVFDVLSWNRTDIAERERIKEDANRLLDWAGVGATRFRMPHELSYGDQRRVEIARALALQPKLLILDEPTAGMVAQEVHAVINLIKRLQQMGITLMLIEHNMNVVMSVSEQIVVLNFGQKIAEGPPDAIRTNPLVIEAYLGTAA